MDTGIPLFFSEIEYLLLETIPLETIMRVAMNSTFFEYNLQIRRPYWFSGPKSTVVSFKT